MSAEPSPSLELVRREASEALERPLPYMTDGEVAAAYRTAKALADSGLFSDVKSAGQAFAKMLAGRDLGLTPFESMSSLHVIEGKVEAGADLHATRVRSRDAYDYRVVWLKIDGEWDGKADARGRLIPPKVVGVPADEEDAADLREVYGCAVEFTVDGERRGVARWTLEDSRVSGLLARSGPKGGPGNHVKFPRSMYFARAMSQGVSLHVPEVMGGLRVYALGELGRGESGEDLGAGAGGEAPAMDALPTAVEAVIARARELGHAGLASRERWATVVSGQGGDVGQAVARATRELNAYAGRQRRGEAEPVPEPPDAEVAPEPETQNKPVCGPEPGEGPTGTGDAPAAQETPQDPPQRDESAPVVDGEVVPDGERAEELRRIAAQLLDDADAAEAEGQPDEAERLRSTAADTTAEADAIGAADQPSFDL